MAEQKKSDVITKVVKVYDRNRTRFPSAIAKELDIQEGDMVTMRCKDGKVLIKKN